MGLGNQDNLISILIVEDNPVDREIYKRLIRKDKTKQYVFYEASSAEDGLKLCRDSKPTCILLDYNLPGMLGIEFIKSLDHARHETAIIVLTGQNSHKLAYECIKAGAEEYIPKLNLDSEDFLHAISNAIEKLRLKRQLEAQHVELTNYYRKKSEFLTNMSHEIRAPLNVILASVELMEKTNKEIALLERTAAIKDSISDILHMINEALDYSRLEANKYPVAIEDVNISKLIYSIIRMFNPLAEKNGLELDLKVASDIPDSVKTDSHKVRHIIKNYLSNAIKFTPKGKIYCKVYKEEEKKGLQYVVISVKDQGAGIAEENHEKIFLAFQQENDSSPSSLFGTGLGLAICKKFSDLIGGEVGLISAKGKGSEFFLKIPARIKDDEASLQ